MQFASHAQTHQDVKRGSSLAYHEQPIWLLLSGSPALGPANMSGTESRQVKDHTEIRRLENNPTQALKKDFYIARM